MKITITLVVISLLLLTNCKQKTMENKKNFVYSMDISAPDEYPVEVHEGVLSNGKQFISAIPSAGVIKGGWGFGGGDAGMKAAGTPNHIELTWISYAEKKFWKIDSPLPADKIQGFFEKGYTRVNRQKVEINETYDRLIIGLAPGGVVVLWLDAVKKVEVGRFQAKEIYVNKLNFQPVKDPNESQEEYFETGFKICVPKEAQPDILKNGIPFGLWDEYRVPYNWRYHTISYKAGADELVSFQGTDFINGEFIINDSEQKMQTTRAFTLKPLPWRTDFNYENGYSSSVEFNKPELMAAFQTMSKKYPNEPLEIIVKIGFEYRGLTFAVKCGEESIPLEKTKVKMYGNG